MEIKYNITGSARKEFVKAVSEITGEPSKYLGMPSCAYAIGSRYTISKEGNLNVADGERTLGLGWLISELEKRGYTAESISEPTEKSDAEETIDDIVRDLL